MMKGIRKTSHTINNVLFLIIIFAPIIFYFENKRKIDDSFDKEIKVQVQVNIDYTKIPTKYLFIDNENEGISGVLSFNVKKHESNKIYFGFSERMSNKSFSKGEGILDIKSGLISVDGNKEVGYLKLNSKKKWVIVSKEKEVYRGIE